MSETHDKAGGALLLKQPQTKTSVAHAHIPWLTHRACRLHPQAHLRRGARVIVGRVHDRHRLSEALRADCSDAGDETYGDGRQRLTCAGVIVRRRAADHARTPEGRDVHGHGVVAAVRPRLPVSLLADDLCPRWEQSVSRPRPVS